jgi:UDP-N-acetylglucosamine 1-carboxyvinyltransferase
MPAQTTIKARELRTNATKAEKKLWAFLRYEQTGFKFRRQFPVGKYIADFACPECKIVIEIDGDTHDTRQAYDADRTKFLESAGYNVLRFSNKDVYENVEGVVETIMRHLKTVGAPPLTPPQSGGVLKESPQAGERETSTLSQIRIVGGHALNGEIPISGAKNAALKLMCAGLLSADSLLLLNAPNALRDIASQTDLMEHLGCVIKRENGAMAINAKNITTFTAPYELVRKMRTSILVLGPLLARFGEAKVSLPGGCAIGTRPIDLHLDGLKSMGAEISLEGGYIDAHAPNGLQGAKILFPKVSVGATENLMMAATLAKGETILANAAREPEIIDLGECLNKMGAQITGLGTSTITIQGVEKLHGATHSILPDRIETGTYMIAVALTGGKVRLKNARIDHLTALIGPLTKAGVKIEEEGPKNASDIIVSRNGAGLVGTDIMTEPYPGFPTDLQAQFMTMLTLCAGAGLVTETIFENRFMHVPELARMGANIIVHGNSAIVRGVDHLTGAEVMATDLRASVALVLAGLVAQGETTINRIYHLERGYENLVEKLSACGAQIERVAGK